MAEEPDQIRQGDDVIDLGRSEWSGAERGGHRLRRLTGGPRATQRGRIETERPSAVAAAKLLASKDCNGCRRRQMLTDRTVVGRRDCPVQGVQQFTDRHRGWTLGAVARIGAAVDDHEVFLGGHDRVQQQLAVLTAWIGISDPFIEGEQVVPQWARPPREQPVIDAQQTDHAMGDGTHRVQRRDGQGAGAEVGSSWPARGGCQPTGRPHPGEPRAVLSLCPPAVSPAASVSRES